MSVPQSPGLSADSTAAHTVPAACGLLFSVPGGMVFSPNMSEALIHVRVALSLSTALVVPPLALAERLPCGSSSCLGSLGSPLEPQALDTYDIPQCYLVLRFPQGKLD